MSALGQSSISTSTAPLAATAGNPLPAVTIFVCANCARPGEAPTSAGRTRPKPPGFAWPWPVREVVVPCTGRLQPEHVLKAFDSGASVVCAVACQEDNCHYIEGSQRCARRVDYLRSILDEIGLGAERLLLLQLPGTASEDMALAMGRHSPALSSEDLDARLAAIRDHVMQALQSLPPNPLYEPPVDEAALEFHQEVDTTDDNPEE
jgi:F420-non-reducing hydrogenase iron-sulfur subunit